MTQQPSQQANNTYDPTDVDTRHRIRTGTYDTWNQGKYKPSKTGGYDVSQDPNRTVNQMVEPISTEGRLDFHDQISGRQDIINHMGEQQNQFAAQVAWQQERQRQEQEYAAYYSEAQSLAGTPYRQNGQMYIQNLDVSDTGEMRMQIIKSAISQMGHAYSWGGGGAGGASTGVNRAGKLGGANTVGFDCSGLVQYAFAQVGLALPRVSRQQAQMGRISDIGSLKPGDLVGWGRTPSTAHHIAIYLGNGRIVESGSGWGSSGVRVRNLNNSSFDRQAFGVKLGI